MMKIMLAFTLALSTLTATGCKPEVKAPDMAPIAEAMKSSAKSSADAAKDTTAKAIAAVKEANDKATAAAAEAAEAKQALAVAEAEKVATIAEAAKHNDGDVDGIVDATDKCPAEAEDKDGFEDDDGCPDLDNDEDKVVDKDDLCPSVAGNAEFSGCVDAPAKAKAQEEAKKLLVEAPPAPDTKPVAAADKCPVKARAPKAKAPCEVKVKTPPAPPTAESVLAELRWYAQKTDKRLDTLEIDAANWRSDHERLDSLSKEVIAGRAPKKTFDLGLANSK